MSDEIMSDVVIEELDHCKVYSQGVRFHSFFTKGVEQVKLWVDTSNSGLPNWLDNTFEEEDGADIIRKILKSEKRKTKINKVLSNGKDR